MNKSIKNLVTYGGLAAGAIALFNAVNKGSSSGVSGLGAAPDPSNYHPSHPWWRWWRQSRDANSHANTNYSLPGTDPYWDQSNTLTPQYGSYGYGGAGSYDPYGYAGGWNAQPSFYGWNYNAQQLEQPGDLASRAAQYD